MSEKENKSNTPEPLEGTPDTRHLLQVLIYNHEEIKKRKSAITNALDKMSEFYSKDWDDKQKEDEEEIKHKKVFHYDYTNQALYDTSMTIIIQELHAVYPVLSNLLDVLANIQRGAESTLGVMPPQGTTNIIQPKGSGILSSIFGKKEKPRPENTNLDSMHKRSEDLIDETKQMPRFWSRFVDWHAHGISRADGLTELLTVEESIEMQKDYRRIEIAYFNSFAKFALLQLVGEAHRLLLRDESDRVGKVATKVYEEADRVRFKPDYSQMKQQ